MAEVRLLALQAPSVAELSLPAGVVGGLVGWTTEQMPLVDFPNNPTGVPILARTTVSLDTAHGRSTSEVLLVFEQGDPQRPVIIGLLRAAPAPLQVVDAPPVEALVDGRRVVLEAEDEIVLRCGQSSITLRRNGRIVVRGTYVETRASGTNRIKGGSVRIN